MTESGQQPSAAATLHSNLLRTRELCWQSLRVLEQALEVTESLSSTVRRLGRPAEAEHYQRRAAYIRQRLVPLRFALLERERAGAPLLTSIARASRGEQAEDGHVSIEDLRSNFDLTAREWEVTRLIIKGFTNRQIAETLVITRGTVANHVAHILSKLNCQTRTQVVLTVLNADSPASEAPRPIEPASRNVQVLNR
jgi:ATP/maltotriose-dependent transcriptional regulator MalT